jgi:anti-sigma factor RsiW
MPRNAERDPRFIKYLLGELPEPERTKLEDKYLGDDETFKRLVAAEEELIYTYVRGGLSPTQHSGFDRLLLQTPERRSRVVFATAFIACLEATAELSGT